MKRINKYPKRSQSHRVGDRAVREFKQKSPDNWVINESDSDYGWDLLITIGEGDQVKEDFYVQAKGSDRPSYIDAGNIISINLKASTVKWLMDKPMPTMLCICDNGGEGKPIYYTWLQEDIKRIRKENPRWNKQKTLVFHIPVSQVFYNNTHRNIEEYVKKFHDDLKISVTIGDTIGPSLGFERTSALSAYMRETQKIVSEKISPFVKEAGLVEIAETEKNGIIIQSLSSEDQKRFKEIKKASEALNELRSDRAKEILDKLDPQIENASTGIKARYFNNKGVLYLHERSNKLALKYFQMASELCPNEPKYLTNTLMTEYILLATEKDAGKITFGNDWIKRLDKVLSKNKDFSNAIRLKSIWLGASKNAKAAEDYLRSKKLWQEEPVVTRCELAEIYKDEGNWDKAINLLSEVENEPEGLDGSYWSLYGTSVFQKALGSIGRQSLTVIHGAGPSQVAIPVLRKSEQSLIRSCNKFERVGFPLISGTTIINLTAVQRILGNTKEAEHFCKSYLRKFLNNPEVSGALASCLIIRDEFPSATVYAKIAFDARPKNNLTYQNYLLCLYRSEDSDALLDLISKRQTDGFTDIREQSLSLSLGAVALNEIGRVDDAFKQINFMKDNPEMLEDAIVAEAVIARNNGKTMKDVSTIYRNALQSYPESPILLTHFIDCLDASNSDDARVLADSITHLSKSRQLIPSEFYTLGNCYMTLRDEEKALDIFKKGEDRFPEECKFLYGQARAFSALGDEERAYIVLKRYFEVGKKDYNVVRNLAFMAMETGRLDEAINLFQKAIFKAHNDDERGNLHCQLWELKRRRNDSPKDIMRHVMEYGKTTGSDPAKEARFLMMAFLSPASDIDEEEKGWNGETRKRLREFSKNHPNFPTFTTFKIPEELSDEEKGSHILSQIAAMMLPKQLATVPLVFSSRTVPYPFVFRAEFLPAFHSSFDYWSYCVSSKDFSSGLHIWHDFNPAEAELKCLLKRTEVCVDLTALLTLAELDLLDLLQDNFNLIVIARGTKRTIDHQLFRIQGPHPLAGKIESWRLRNRAIIRVRNVPDGKEVNKDELDEDQDYDKNIGGIFLHRQKSVNHLISDGVGESIMLAQRLNLPLYSDDSYIRKLGSGDYGVNGFCTIAFIKQLRKEDILSLRKETAILCQMIRKNFRVVSFDKDHLNCCLKEITNKLIKEKNTLPKSQDLLADDDMGTLLRQFGDQFFNERWLASIAVTWWTSLLEKEDIDSQLLTECLEYPSYALSMRIGDSGIFKGVKRHDQENRLAHILGYFLVRSSELKNKPIVTAWSSIKSCCEKLFHNDQTKYEKTLFVFLPRWTVEEISDMKLSNQDKQTKLISISSYLPVEDRDKIANVFIKLKPLFMSVY